MLYVSFLIKVSRVLNYMSQGNIPPVPIDGSDWPGLCLEVRHHTSSLAGLANKGRSRTPLWEFASQITLQHSQRALMQQRRVSYSSQSRSKLIPPRFNRELIRRRGLFMGQEHAGKGVNVALGPMMNLGRVAEGGRNWEGFGADPYLAAEAAYETVLGLQQGGVQACAKHLVNK